MMRLVLVCALVSGCAMHHVTPDPQRFLLPYVDPDALLCVQQEDRWSCIHVGDLRKLLASMGHA